MSKFSLKFCIAHLRKLDYYRYLTAIFFNTKYQKEVFPLYCLYATIAEIEDCSTEDMIILLKFNWWREAIDDLYKGKTRNNEILKALLSARIPSILEKNELISLIDAKEQESIDKALYNNNFSKDNSNYIINKIIFKVITSDKQKELLPLLEKTSKLTWLIAKIFNQNNEHLYNEANHLLKDLTNYKKLIKGNIKPLFYQIEICRILLKKSQSNNFSSNKIESINLFILFRLIFMHFLKI